MRDSGNSKMACVESVWSESDELSFLFLFEKLNFNEFPGCVGFLKQRLALPEFSDVLRYA